MSAPLPFSRELALRLLHDMLSIRRLEECAAELYGEGKIRGFLHLYIGEEAVAVGALHALTPDDAVVATYREHGHALIQGVCMQAIMAEMYGKQKGGSRGRSGALRSSELSDAGSEAVQMDATEIPCQVLEERQRIAPELEPEQLRGDRPLRDQVDLDSMDRLRLLGALHKRLGVNIPEADYRRLDSRDAMVEYLDACC